MKTLIFFFSIMMGSLFAQQPVQNFTLVNVADNSAVSLESYQSCSAIVVIFTGNECAYDGYYTARIKALVDKYKGKIQFLLINSYIEANESADKMRTVYNGWGMPVPYLADKDQTAMDCLNAKKSPEAFLLKNDGGKYTIAYSGAIDDNAQVSAAVKETYLRKAIDQLLAGQPIEVANVRAVGCSMRRK
ncbi:MAG: thioredoxin family protein [Azospira oryzae]|jgi:hypothetical protein|nr:MAG: thioredoxin family protein [Azospira oryzae]